MAKPKKSSVSHVNDNAVIQVLPVATTDVFPESTTTIVVDESVRASISGNDDCKKNGQTQVRPEKKPASFLFARFSSPSGFFGLLSVCKYEYCPASKKFGTRGERLQVRGLVDAIVGREWMG